MKLSLLAAGLYHILFGIWTNLWPYHFFDLGELARPSHPVLWRGVGLLSALLGVGLLIASRAPIRHWLLVLIAFLKSNFVIMGLISSYFDGPLPPAVFALIAVDDIVWWFPLAATLWAAARAYAGQPPLRDKPLSLEEAAAEYHLSSGESLAKAARSSTVALVFLRHFGCTFTRQILRHLEDLKKEADRRGARLVLVHMLEQGRESDYIADRDRVARISDPLCELYRAFGLGKGSFLELFGPRVWWPMAVALMHGCGLGHLAGDGLQMPGAFLFRDGKILASQRARTQADLPDLPCLFKALREDPEVATVPA